MLKHKWFIATIALLLGFVLGGGAVYWCFSGGTRPWGAQSQLDSVHGETGEGSFAFGTEFVAPPVIKLSGPPESSDALKNTIVVETTTTGLRWKNVGKTADCDGKLDVHAVGRISKAETERLGHRWLPFSSWQLW